MATLISLTAVRTVLLVLSAVLYRKGSLRGIYSSSKFIPAYIWILSLLAVIFMVLLAEFNNFPVNTAEKQNIITGLIALLAATLIVMTVSLLINVSKKNRFDSVNHILKKQIEMQLRQYEKQLQLSSDLRRFRHDYKNHLAAILALIENEYCRDAKDYINKITASEHSSRAVFFTGNRLADIILSDKNEFCSEFAVIEFDGYITDAIDNYDMCALLANALDNAIEACEKLKEKSRIRIASQVRQGYFVMTMQNPTSLKSADKPPRTAKSDPQNHGLGLISIEQTVKKYDGTMSIEVKNGIFELSVAMKI
ncbi:MAG: GHKL domain-containing protein [Ruminococcus sp.]|nr:GHKL domain-containing protein [Ruminococcus sp.]